METSAVHEIFQYLPQNILGNPERSTIQAFLKKKHRYFSRLMIAMIIGFVIYLVLLYIFEILHTTITELAVFDNIFNLLPLAIFLVLVITFHIRRKMFAIPDSEIDNLIKQLKSQQVPA